MTHCDNLVVDMFLKLIFGVDLNCLKKGVGGKINQQHALHRH